MTTLTKTAAVLLLAGLATQAQTIISDDFNVENVNSGFTLGEGVNSGINPPVTRLTGTAADGLSYLNATPAQKAETAYTIDANGKVRITAGSQSGRFTLTDDGSTPFDFSTALGIGTATPANPVMYDVTVSMDNNGSGTQRFSFALGTQEGATGVWDFGLQLHRANAVDDFHSVSKRIDLGSSGLASDQNAVIFAMPAGTVGTEVDFLIRVTDAGAETDTFSSRIQVSTDGGTTWSYDTQADSTLVNGFRFDGASRIFDFDIAPNDKFVTYDNFSVTIIPEPSVSILALVGGLAMLIRRKI